MAEKEKLALGDKNIVPDDMRMSAIIKHQTTAQRVINQIALNQIASCLAIKIDAPPKRRFRPSWGASRIVVQKLRLAICCGKGCTV